MADAADLNSAARKGVRVRISAPAPICSNNRAQQAQVEAVSKAELLHERHLTSVERLRRYNAAWMRE